MEQKTDPPWCHVYTKNSTLTVCNRNILTDGITDGIHLLQPFDCLGNCGKVIKDVTSPVYMYL